MRTMATKAGIYYTLDGEYVEREVIDRPLEVELIGMTHYQAERCEHIRWWEICRSCTHIEFRSRDADRLVEGPL